MNTLFRFAALAFGVAGCATRPAPPSASATKTSFDGRYEGSVQVAGAAVGVNIASCATDPHLTLQVVDNTFTYVQPHPDVAGTAPSLTPEATTATYSASIAADGSISGTSGRSNATIRGGISGTHMSGTIKGILCSYTFTADRV